MQELGWLARPAVFPWVALGLGLCIGSFLKDRKSTRLNSSHT